MVDFHIVSYVDSDKIALGNNIHKSLIALVSDL